MAVSLAALLVGGELQECAQIEAGDPFPARVVAFRSDHEGNTAVLSLPGDPRKAAPVAPESVFFRRQAPGQPV